MPRVDHSNCTNYISKQSLETPRKEKGGMRKTYIYTQYKGGVFATLPILPVDPFLQALALLWSALHGLDRSREQNLSRGIVPTCVAITV